VKEIPLVFKVDLEVVLLHPTGEDVDSLYHQVRLAVVTFLQMGHEIPILLAAFIQFCDGAVEGAVFRLRGA